MNRIFVLLLAIVILTVSGCPPKEDSPPGPKPPADVFNETQRDTITPHGPIDPDSAQDMPDGSMDYTTGGGADRWKTWPRSDGNDKYDFGTPERVPTTRNDTVETAVPST